MADAAQGPQSGSAALVTERVLYTVIPVSAPVNSVEPNQSVVQPDNICLIVIGRLMVFTSFMALIVAIVSTTQYCAENAFYMGIWIAFFCGLAYGLVFWATGKGSLLHTNDTFKCWNFCLAECIDRQRGIRIMPWINLAFAVHVGILAFQMATKTYGDVSVKQTEHIQFSY
jgi:hypothetical protein